MSKSTTKRFTGKHYMLRKSLVAATIVSLSGMDVQADTFSARVDTTFQNLIADDEPGCSVGVIESGEWLFRKSYGLASMEFGVPMTSHSVHNLASVSKQFTAMAVHLLADEGKIDLDEDIRTYLPALKDYGERVTINAMLGHVSGMVNFSDYEYVVSQPGGEEFALTTAIGGPLRFEDEEYISTEDLYDYVQRLPLRYLPNERYHYSNVAYFLLSMLVEEVSGQSLATYSERKIFQPLGMSNTLFVDSPLPIIDNLATGYGKLGGRYVRQDGNYYWVGDSRLHTTLDDLLIWDHHFYTPRLGSDPATLIAGFNQPNSTIEVHGQLYANGQVVADQHEQTVFSHSGASYGTRTYYERYPESEFSTIVLCNDASRQPVNYAKFIAQYYFYPDF